jgi:hypothetical protein
MAGAYIRWYEEDAPADGGEGGTRRVRAAWLVRDVVDASGERQEVLAYLGRRPAVTATLREEIAALYPDLEVDWEAIRRAIAEGAGYTNVAALTDDDLALRLGDLARERGMTLMDLALRLGYRQRQVLPEMLTLLADASRVARYERTAGSVFDYMLERHPEYAYLIYKARLFFEGDDAGLAADIAAEPAGFDDAAWQARRQFWRERLAAYCQARRPPGGAR